MNKLSLLIPLLFLIGCSNKTQQERDSFISGNVKYVKDHRTDLCFAYLFDGAGHSSRMGLAHVPCDQVKDQRLEDLSKDLGINGMSNK